MRKHLTASSLVAFGGSCERLYLFIRVMAAIHLFLAAACTVGGAFSPSAIQPIGALFFAILPAVTICLYVIGKVLCRPHTVNGRSYSPEMYALITDGLRGRKITGTKRYLEEHPDYPRMALELEQEIWSAIKSDSALKKMVALVYSSTASPQQTKRALLSIVNERGITDPDTARALLSSFNASEAPLMSGAL